jgi:hypothetical protein
MAAWKFRDYFSVHQIVVVNEAPFSSILNNPKATGRVSMWGSGTFPLDLMYEKKEGHQIPNLARFHG